MQARAAQAPIYNARCVRTSHLVSGDKTARHMLSLVILTCISSTNTPLLLGLIRGKKVTGLYKNIMMLYTYTVFGSQIEHQVEFECCPS